MGDCQGPNPGPAYALGTLTGFKGHDFTKNRAPAYSLGLKARADDRSKTPGPYKVENVSRHGKYPYQGWTIESKSVYRGKPFGPGPLDYAPEKMKIYTPSYSLGLKLAPKDKAFGPSAADYLPQWPCGGAPAYTIAGAHKDLTKFMPPGPQAATPLENYKQRAPAYSLGLSRKNHAGVTPGPGPTYMPMKPCMKGCRGFSFGLKHSKCSPPMITYEDTDL